MHSATKFLGGHGVALGGVLVDGGHFDWDASGLFGTLTEPYAGYHGISFSDEFGPSAFVSRARTEGLRDFGACMSPANAFQILQGVETLPLRMQRHVANTTAVVDALAANHAVSWVKYPSMPDHPDHELARRLYPRGTGAILSFGIAGGRDAGAQVHLCGPAGLAPGQCGRRQDAGHPPGQHHPPADVSRGSGRGRGGGGPGEDLGRTGGPQRHHRGPGAGPQGLPALGLLGVRDRDSAADDAPLRRHRGQFGIKGLARAHRKGPIAMEQAIDGQIVRCATGGRGLDGDPPAVVLVHGAGGDRTVWQLQTRWIAHHGYRAAAVDLPGHGGSDGPVRATIAEMGAWLAGTVEALGLAPAPSGRPLDGHLRGAGGGRPGA